MRCRTPLAAVLALACGVLLGAASLTAPLAARAQDATPATEGMPTGGLPVVAAGLANPRGMVWGEDGTMYVALAGSGGDTPGVPETPPPLGPFMGGPTASVVQVEDGCPVAVADGLPSTRDGTGGVTGAADVAILGGQLYALVAGGSEALGNPDTTNGVYQVNADGTTALLADLSAWLLANPPDVAGWTAPPEGFPNPGNPYAMVTDEDTGVLWVVDAVNSLVLTVGADGTVTLAGDLSEGHPVLTGIAVAPEGGVYVANLTPAPFPEGDARVVHVDADGTVEEVWTGLTTVTGLVVGPDDELYALEMSTGNTEEPPFLQPGTGRVVRQTGPDELAEVATGLLFPVALDVGPDDALYVGLPALGADAGTGMIIRLAVGEESASPAADAPATVPACPIPVATPEAAPRAPDEETPEA